MGARLPPAPPLPAASVRDITIHGDDLIVATHGRSFWILDDITPLRQMDAQAQNANVWLYQPATAIRIDNDFFPGTPLPPEEPVAKNPPDGAVLDYYLNAAAKQVTLEISDAGNKLVRRYTSNQRRQENRPPLPIAERWLPKPVVLENSAGAHRFVWDLRWSSSGTSEAEEDEGFGAPRGPRVIPGTYQVKLTVDGKPFTQDLKVEMDPRAKVTAGELEEQLRFGLEVFGEVHRARRTLAEIGAIKKRLAEMKQQLAGKNRGLQARLTGLETTIASIEKGSKSSMGLESASAGLSSALRVVESSDRTIPSQAIELYREADDGAKRRTAEWTQLKGKELVDLNHALVHAGVGAIQISQIEK